MQQCLTDERGRWILNPNHTDCHNEYPLSTVIAGEPIHIIIDRTFIDKDNIRWIIDYKTSHTTDDLDAFLDQEQARYRTQLELYGKIFAMTEARPIKLGLYFPLHCAWREWSYIDEEELVDG